MRNFVAGHNITEFCQIHSCHRPHIENIGWRSFASISRMQTDWKYESQARSQASSIASGMRDAHLKWSLHQLWQLMNHTLVRQEGLWNLDSWSIEEFRSFQTCKLWPTWPQHKVRQCEDLGGGTEVLWERSEGSYPDTDQQPDAQQRCWQVQPATCME